MQFTFFCNIISGKYSKRGIIIKELQKNTEAKEKKEILGKVEVVLTAIGCVFIVFMMPFIYTIVANILIRLGAIESIEQLEQCNKIFRNFNIIIIVSFAILIMYESKVSISDIINRISANFDFLYKKGDSEIQVRHIESNIHNYEINKMAKEIKEEAQEQIIKGDVKKSNDCDSCEIEINEIINERESLRYFSAYQITNKFSRELLKTVKNNDKIEIEIFKDSMIEYYEKTIRNMGKKRKQEFIAKKIEELLYNLRYLNIIEYTEEGKFIILTQNGAEFVKGYSYDEEVG